MRTLISTFYSVIYYKFVNGNTQIRTINKPTEGKALSAYRFVLDRCDAKHAMIIKYYIYENEVESEFIICNAPF